MLETKALSRVSRLQYRPKPITSAHCKAEGCDRPILARGYCEAHYRHGLKHGTPLSDFGYGERRNHSLYESWRWQVRVKEGRVSEWNDFWRFVEDVGERPSPQHKVRRYDITKPFGPSNWRWAEFNNTGKDAAEYQRKWRAKNAVRAKGYSLKSGYGISMEKYMEMYEQQHGCCALCKKPGASFVAGNQGRVETLAVDHDHKTKKVRSLLCHQCNKGIGCFGESVVSLRQAIEYLERYS